MVVVNHEAPDIPPILVEGGYDGGGFVELLAPGALALLDVAILLGLYGWMSCIHAAFLV